MADDTILQNERTALLSSPDAHESRRYRSTDDEHRWSLARRRSSAFFSFLSEPEDKEGDQYREYRRSRTTYILVFLSVVFYSGISVQNAFTVELIQTLACAEYYYPHSTGSDPTFPTLPTAGDPRQFCSTPSVDKRVSQIMSTSDTFSSIVSVIATFVLAKAILPRYSRRTVAIVLTGLSVLFLLSLGILPTHYSFDPAIPSSSTVHPTFLLHLLLILPGLLGFAVGAFPLIMQVMTLDTCKEDQKTAAFAKILAANLVGNATAPVLLKLIFPYFNLHFSILRHDGPCSPFLLATSILLVDLLLIITMLPETKPNLVRPQSDRESESDTSSLSGSQLSSSAQQLSPGVETTDSSSRVVAVAKAAINSLNILGYLLPYRSSPGAKMDFKLPLMLIALLLGDSLASIWGTLVVFEVNHLGFGPEDVATYIGAVGVSKGFFNMLALPWIVNRIRRSVKKWIREETIAREESIVSKRERYVIITDQIVSVFSLAFDVVGWACVGLAASRSSTLGNYASTVGLLAFAAGAIPSIQALAVDLFQAQNRPTEDPVAARDAFLGLFMVLFNVTTSVGPLLNNFIYRVGVDKNMPFLTFFWTAGISLASLLIVSSVGTIIR